MPKTTVADLEKRLDEFDERTRELVDIGQRLEDFDSRIKDESETLSALKERVDGIESDLEENQDGSEEEKADDSADDRIKKSG